MVYPRTVEEQLKHTIFDHHTTVVFTLAESKYDKCHKINVETGLVENQFYQDLIDKDKETGK